MGGLQIIEAAEGANMFTWLAKQGRSMQHATEKFLKHTNLRLKESCRPLFSGHDPEGQVFIDLVS